ncbi:MotA/TolQ/ExbB proton channel family protein [Aureivirga sp. CE67]|uniref:MotA/TolQ/ExbB proton channel family protein n=1 Tax=Aureivirga sp. CE67 TaxID=1788983 RepID=UPI0018C9FA8D|nr:MotA/TolQ/ExbB proton channel family protein [Aureivirga sp. CE67]
MDSITNILYWVSTGLLIPVIALLLFGFVRALMLLGGFFGMYINRLKYESHIQDFLKQFSENKITENDIQEKITGNKLFKNHLLEIVKYKSNEHHIEKILSDFEIASEKELSSSKSLAKLGPMVGLMGTLIPLGPALVGLANGDIASMAQNMQVAFSTTVVGIFAGAIGYVTQLVKQRWFISDLNNLEFLANTLKNKN